MRVASNLLTLILIPAVAVAQTTATSPTWSALDWHPKPAALSARCESAIAATRKQIALALSRPLPQRSFDNSLRVIEAVTTDLSRELSPLTFLFYVAPDSAVRAASVDCDQKSTTFFVDLSSNPDLYATAKALSAQNAGSSAADRRLIALWLEYTEHAGGALDSATRRQTTALFNRLKDLEREFVIALATDTTTIVVSPAGIAGLPPELVATLKRASDGRYIVPVNASTNQLVMRNAISPDTRERYLRALERIGGTANIARLSRALVLRDSLARLMGVRNWATYQLQTKMAKTPEQVLSFLNEVDSNLLSKARAERAERAALKKASGDGTPYRPWDSGYYARLLRKQKYDLDEQEIRQYFPVDRVISGVLDIYSHLLGVRFAEITPADAWAPGVQQFTVTDSASGSQIGTVYLDLYPRPNKYKHFAAWTLHPRLARAGGATDKAIAAIVGNWPTPEPGKPALLSHDDVVTFFHEFGHLMAGTLGTSPYSTNLFLRQDFVEALSQMLENWMWQPEVLRLVSRNIKTGQPLPKALIDRMLAAKHFGDGDNYTHQAFYGVYDMTLASSPPTIDVSATWDDLYTRLTAGEVVSGGTPAASFGHLMSGYDAGYYGYLWSLVYAQDLFTRFEKEGVLNKQTGLAYRRIILEPGGLREPDELLREFLGRPLSFEAFYRDVGIRRSGQSSR